jgi:hypothetical protein
MTIITGMLESNGSESCSRNSHKQEARTIEDATGTGTMEGAILTGTVLTASGKLPIKVDSYNDSSPDPNAVT